MCGRSIDGLKKGSDKMKVVPCSVKKLVILGYLIQHMSTMGYGSNEANKPSVARASSLSLQ